jgi:hypothetical protein
MAARIGDAGRRDRRPRAVKNQIDRLAGAAIRALMTEVNVVRNHRDRDRDRAAR